MAKAVEYLKGKRIAIARESIDLGESFRGGIQDHDGLIIELRQMEVISCSLQLINK